nr:hypothetical protein [uncultured Pseudodesulfovibrio sp.]
MSSNKSLFITLALLAIVMAYVVPAGAQSGLGAAAEVEGAIQSAMSSSATGSGPTLGQLGGVQAGSTESNAGRSVGCDGSSGSNGMYKGLIKSKRDIHIAGFGKDGKKTGPTKM